MAVAPQIGITRAMQALDRLAGRRADDTATCLACGEPVGDEPVVLLHGDAFHSRCAVYRGRQAT